MISLFRTDSYISDVSFDSSGNYFAASSLSGHLYIQSTQEQEGGGDVNQRVHQLTYVLFHSIKKEAKKGSKKRGRR